MRDLEEIWRGGTYLFGAPETNMCAPLPTYLKGLPPRPRVPRNDKILDGAPRAAPQLRDQVEEALAAGRAHHGRVATADVRRQTEGTKRRRAGEVPGTHAMM